MLLATLAGTTALDAGKPWDEKIDRGLRERSETGPTEVLIVLEGQADLSGVELATTRAERGQLVFERLRRHAERSQASLRRMLRGRGVEHRPFWIVNAIWARADAALIADVARRQDVARVESNPRVPSALPRPDGTSGRLRRAGVEWNVLKVEADAVWALGFTGSGVVIGGQDTGYDWTHPALRPSYRGWDGFSADHAYNWHDAIHTGGGPCGHDALAPCDDDGHGTHTLGTMVGDDGGVNRVGVAPGARWIGCRNMDSGNGTAATYTECFQWFVAPTDASGRNPDPARAPDVINNSWNCPAVEGCSANTLKTVIENVRAAGIVVVSSTGNTGPSCATVQLPPAIYGAVFSVGATDSTDTIASFSSRGPVTVDGSNRRKPDVVAPGLDVRATWPGGGYAVLSGTSMAGPHVVGLVALLLDARPDLRGRVDEIEAIIERSAVPFTPGQSCGGDVIGVSVPNHVYGYGRVDALAMLEDDADSDATANLGDCAPIDGSTWAAPAPVTTLRFTGPSHAILSWDTPPSPGAVTPRFDVLRATAADGFAAATCIGVDLTSTSLQDTAVPGNALFYLVRVRNACGEAVLPASDGLERLLPGCF